MGSEDPEEEELTSMTFESVSQILDWLEANGPLCGDCRSPLPVELCFYGPHDGGLHLEELHLAHEHDIGPPRREGDRVWVFVRCAAPTCRYEWSLHKVLNKKLCPPSKSGHIKRGTAIDGFGIDL